MPVHLPPSHPRQETCHFSEEERFLLPAVRRKGLAFAPSAGYEVNAGDAVACETQCIHTYTSEPHSGLLSISRVGGLT